MKIFKEFYMLDGTGGDIRSDVAFVVDNSVIKEIIPKNSDVGESIEVIDLEGRYPFILNKGHHLSRRS